MGGSFTVSNKVYDGTAAATIATNSLTLLTKEGSDVVTLTTVAVFADKVAGAGKTVTLTGSSITGVDAPNYTLSLIGAPTATASITAKVLTTGGTFTVNNKVYDGTASATIITNSLTLLTKVGADEVTLTAVALFTDKAVGTGKTVTLTGSTLTGADALNYTLSLTGAPTTTANITSKVLTIGGSFTVNNKVYDGTTAATIATNSLTLLTKEGSDAVTLNPVAVFANSSIGIGKTVSLTGSSLTGADAPNYTLSLIGSPTTTANITAFGLIVTGITASNKVYDGTTIATLNTSGAVLSGILGSDEVTLITTGATGTFVNKNIGTGKLVTVNGLVLTGSDADKYSLIPPTTTANISPTGLTIIMVTGNNKVYDGTTIATLNTGSASLAGIFGGDNVTLVSTGATGVFANKNVGTSKSVATSGFTLSGVDAGNYTLTQPTTVANITTASLTVSSVVVNNKVYDGTTLASLNTVSASLVGILGADAVSLITSGATGSFADKNVGAAKTVVTSGFTLTGTDSGNYTLIQPSIAGNITPKPLSIIADYLSKNYGTVLTFTGSEYMTLGLVYGDIITGVTLTSTGSAASNPVGEYAISVSGGVNNNYTITYVNGILTVNKSPLIARADYKTKVYGSANPSLSITYSGFMNGEDASVLDSPPVASTTAQSTSNAGSYAILLTGGSDNNYDLTLVNGSMEIGKAPLTITAENKTKVYGNANPAFTIAYSGFVLGQDQSVLMVLPVAATTANLTSDAGTYDINISGADAQNYSFIYVKGVLTITKVDQVITFAPIPSGLRMTEEYQMLATASSGLTVSFEVTDPDAASVNGNVLRIIRDGNITITARQEGNQNWNPAPDVIQSIVTLPTFDNITSLFTPNNDGINDYWYIPDLEQYGTIQVTVYNRFGQPVYQSDSYQNDWDGTWNGYPLPSATYYYIIKSSEKGYIKGVVNIVR